MKIIVYILLSFSLVFYACNSNTDPGSSKRSAKCHLKLKQDIQGCIDLTDPNITIIVETLDKDGEPIENGSQDFTGSDVQTNPEDADKYITLDKIPTKGAFGVSVYVNVPCGYYDCCSYELEFSPLFVGHTTDLVEGRKEYNITLYLLKCIPC